MIKKLLFIALISFLTLQPISAAPKDNPSKMERVKSKIEAVDSIPYSAIGDSVRAILKDTIYKSQSLKQEQEPNSTFRFQYETDPGDSDAVGLMIIIGIPFLFIFLIIMGCLIISYRKRKDKYRLIEKAIENNYQLPEYMFNDIINPRMPDFEDSTPQNANASAPQAPVFPTNHKEWASIKSGIILSSVGLGLFLFFIPRSIAWACSIVFFIGIGKLIMVYLQKKHTSNSQNQYYRNWNNHYAPQQNDAKKDSGSCPPPIPSQPLNTKNNSESENA